MRALRRILKRLRSWATTQQDEERLLAEIEEHLALQTEDNIRCGMSLADARRQAVLKFGAQDAVKESYRHQRGIPFLETLVRDIRYSLRRLRMTPAFTVTTILTLALGIGASTSIFTMTYAVLMKSLAVASPGELYRLGKEARCCYWGGYAQDKEFSLVSYDLYKHFRDNTSGFAELAAFQASEELFGVRRAGATKEAHSYPGEFVSGNYFKMFGIEPYTGRSLTPQDDQPGATPVAVMSYRLWQQAYGSDPSVINSVFNLNDRPFIVVGITPPSFFGDSLRTTPPDFFLPLNTEPAMEGDLYKIDNHWLDLIGRIRPGVKPASIEAQMRVELKQWLRSHWDDMSATERAKFPEQTLFLMPGGAGITSMRDQYEHWLHILIMVSAFVLLIVCANVANLMLVRGMERRRLTSLSMALGARASRLVAEAVTESILLSLIGGAVGLAVAFAATRLILHFAFPTVNGMAAVPISASPSIPVLLFAFITSTLTGLLFGIAPAWMASRADPLESLRGANRSTARFGLMPRKLLVVLQAALSLVLLSVSGLLIAALHSLENEDFGFGQDHRIVVSLNPRLAGYNFPQLTRLYQRLKDSISSIPGVSAVALCTYSPLSGKNWAGGMWIDGHPAPGPEDDNLAFWDRVTAGYFPAVGQPILKGRTISGQDTATSPHVAVINQAFAKKFFHNEDPIGKHFGQHGLGSEREYEVIGIAADARYVSRDIGMSVTPFFFLPEAQHDFLPKDAAVDANPGSHFLHDIVIVSRPGSNLSSAQLREAIASVDPDLPVISIRPMNEQVAAQFTQQRLIARLTSLLGVLSLLLASIGLYGVTAYNAARRAGEISVRVALGAHRSHIVRMVLRGGFILVFWGLFIGLPLTFAAGRFLGSQLYGVNPYNPAVTLSAVAMLALSGLAASLIPALRASLTSPLEVLRVE